MNLIFHDLLGVILEIYIEDMVVKSAGFHEHMADLRISLERMRKYGLKMNPLKCMFGMTVARFLGSVVHGQGIQVDPKNLEAISKMEELACKWDVQKHLGKINYLMRFIANLASKIGSFLPLLKLKHEEEFCWGQSKEPHWTRLRNIW
jgi:hypothetical protein